MFVAGNCMLRLEDGGVGLQEAVKERVKAAPAKGEGACGAPVVLVVSASAVAANGIVKKLRDPCLGRVAKLFAKHLKVEEQCKELREGSVLVGVGTPGRVLKLAELGALSTERLGLLVLDVQRDAKLMTVMDIPETRADFSRILSSLCLPRFSQGNGLRLCLVDGSKL